MRFRNAMFTVFDLHSFDLNINSVIHISEFLIFQMEIAPDTGKPHYQGYIELKGQMGLKALQKIFGSKCHFEARRGTQKQAIDYCSKQESREGETIIVGEPRKQGERGDITEAYYIIATTKDITKVEPSLQVKYGKALQNAMLYAIKPKTESPISHLWYGQDETEFITEFYKEGTFIYDCSTEWNGYKGEENIIYNAPLPSDLNRMLDKYPYKIRVLYGIIEFNPKNIYFRTYYGNITVDKKIFTNVYSKYAQGQDLSQEEEHHKDWEKIKETRKESKRPSS